MLHWRGSGRTGCALPKHPRNESNANESDFVQKRDLSPSQRVAADSEFALGKQPHEQRRHERLALPRESCPAGRGSVRRGIQESTGPRCGGPGN
jgi:hypothetical protein